MFHITILALGTIIASSVFADRPSIHGEAGQVSPHGVPTVTYEIHEAIKSQNKTAYSIRLAAVDTQDEPRCAADGVCNPAVCSAAQDPDCPEDLPPGAGAEPATTPAVSLETVDCTSTQSVDILALPGIWWTIGPTLNALSSRLPVPIQGVAFVVDSGITPA